MGRGTRRNRERGGECETSRGSNECVHQNCRFRLKAPTDVLIMPMFSVTVAETE